MAFEQYEAIYPQSSPTAVVRRIVKKGIIYGGRWPSAWIPITPQNLCSTCSAWPGKQPRRPTPAAGVFCLTKFRSCGVELPAGPHRDRLATVGPGGLGREETQSVTIANGRNTYVLANFPDTQLVRQNSHQPAVNPAIGQDP